MIKKKKKSNMVIGYHQKKQHQHYGSSRRMREKGTENLFKEIVSKTISIPDQGGLQLCEDRLGCVASG